MRERMPFALLGSARIEMEGRLQPEGPFTLAIPSPAAPHHTQPDLA
jgi:hypothetical protein